MPAPPVQSGTAGGTGGSTGNTQPFTTNVTTGNLLVLFILNATDSTTTITAINWTGGNSGTLTATPLTPITLAGRRMWVYTAQITAATGTGVTVTFSASINSVVLFAEYAGMATSNVIDQEISGTGTGTAIASANATTTNANDTLVGGIFITSAGGGTLTAGASFTAQVNSANARMLEDRNVVATGSYAATATYSSSQTYIAHLLALKQASATPVVATPTVDNPAGTYAGSVTVAVSSTTPGAAFCYRTDGVDPAAGTPGTCDAGSGTYTAPIVLTGSATLKVIGTEAGYQNSAILTQAYIVRGAATWYVSTTGSDSNSGATAALPWAHAPGMTGATGVAASTVLLPGDTILLKRGDSWLNTTLTVNAGGTAGNPITLGAYGAGADPIISAAANSPAVTATAANRGFWTIDGLDLRASGLIAGISLPATIYHNYWSADLLPVPNWVIQNCHANAAFYLSGPNTTVRANVLDGTANSNPPYAGIILRGQVNTNGLIESNNVSHFTDRGIWVMRAANNPVIRYNTVHDILAGGNNEGMGINLDGFEIPVTGAQTYANWIYNCAGMGITHENSTGSKAWFNLIHDCVKAGIDVINYDAYQSLPSNIEIAYNVIFNTNVGIMILNAGTISAIGNTLYQGTGANSFAYGIWTADTYVAALTFVNNIVAGAWTHPIQVRTSKAVWASFDYDDIAPTGAEIVYQADTTVSQTLAQIRALGLMTHGITADPQFAAAGSKFALLSSSPAIKAGLDLGSNYQQALLPSSAWPNQVVAGTQTPGRWNMGAYLGSVETSIETKDTTRLSSVLVRGMRSDANTIAKVLLTIQQVPGQTADLIQFKNSAGAVVGRIDAEGNPGTVAATISSIAITGSAAGQLGHAAGVVLAPDPGAGKVIELVSAVLWYIFGTAAYTAGGNLTINSNGGAALTGLVSAANSVGAGADKVAQFVPLATAGAVLTVNKGLNLVSSAAFTQPGTAVGTIKVFMTYRIHTL